MSSLKMVANVSSTCIHDVLQMAQEAYRTGYDAVMVLPPYYYGQTPKQLLSYFRRGTKAQRQMVRLQLPAAHRQ